MKESQRREQRESGGVSRRPWLYGRVLSLGAQLGRFGMVGIAATATHSVIFVGAIELLNMAAVPAVVLAFSLAVLVSHFGHHRWTFRSQTRHREALPRFFLVALAGLTLNALITWVVVDMLGLWYGLALALGITAVPVVTFILARWLVYSAQENPS